ncbi:hypothetical protein J6590_036192 [Homalodisca vitripennis]|nr:hypothetical protein J6590_036192 [Homalodisca vitripennis]
MRWRVSATDGTATRSNRINGDLASRTRHYFHIRSLGLVVCGIHRPATAIGRRRGNHYQYRPLAVQTLKLF